MKFWRNRFLALALGLALALPLLLAGCAGREKTPKLEDLAINVYDSVSDYVGEQGGWYGNILAKTFHVKLNFLDTAQEGALEAADLIIYRAKAEESPAGAGTMGDEDVEDKIRELIEQNVLLDMKPYLEEREIWEYESQMKYWNKMFSEEGIYVIPTDISRMPPETPLEERIPLYGIYIRWDAYKEAGYPRLHDRDDLLGVLQGLCGTGTGKIGISLYREEGDDILEELARIVGAYGYETCGFAMYRQNALNDVGILDDAIPLIKGNPLARAVRWLWEANRLGLLDEDSRTQGREEALNKYWDGSVILHAQPRLGIPGYELVLMEDMEVVSHGCNPKGTLDTFVAVGKGTEEPERVLDLVSWLYSAEGIMDSGTYTEGKTAGPMGLTWEVSKGMPVLTEFGEKVLRGEDQKLPEGWGEGTWEEGRCRLGLQPVTPVETSPSGFLYNYTLWSSVKSGEGGTFEDWSARAEAGSAMEYLIENGELSVIPSYVELKGREYEDTEEIALLRKELKAMIEDSLWEILYAPEEETYERLWREMIQRAKTMGYEKVRDYDLEKVNQLRKAREEASR